MGKLFITWSTQIGAPDKIATSFSTGNITTVGTPAFSREDFLMMFLKCNDTAVTRDECGEMLRREIIKKCQSNADDLYQVSHEYDFVKDSNGVIQIGKKIGIETKRLFDWSNSKKSGSYHKLVDRCARHFCVPLREIKKLPLRKPKTVHTARKKREEEQREKFYSRSTI
tara:strand:+ start:50 stop:556 length:507 start_codon:yes stop_codon:yes gene_type:complete